MPVMVTNDFPPNHGGIQRLMSRLAQELALMGERIVVVAPQNVDSKAFDGLQRYRVLRYPGKGRMATFVTMVAYVLWARLRWNDSLTIASMWFPGGLAAGLVPRAMRGKLGVLAHGTEIAPARGGIRRVIMRYVFKQADFIIANSSFTRDLLRKAGVRGEISVVPPGIDAEPIAPARSSVPTILSVGRLVARKGFDTTILALPAILERYPTTRYEIIGSGPQRAELEALAIRLTVQDHVAFLGSVSDEEMRSAYARAWIFALPVRSIGNDVEGFGLVYLEAALAELPAIGGSNSGAGDAIVPGQTGLLVDGTSSAEVASAALSLLADPVAPHDMGVRARERALQFFTWNRAAKEVAKLTGMTSRAKST